MSHDKYKLLHSILIKNRNLIKNKAEMNWKQNNSPNSLYSFNKEVIKHYETLLKHQQFVKFINYNLDSHFRKYSYMESLDWHTDSRLAYKPDIDRRYAVTYYINKNWNEQYGGEFMFKDSVIRGFIPPMGNSLIIIKSGFKHKVNPVIVKNTPRFSIQTWIT